MRGKRLLWAVIGRVYPQGMSPSRKLPRVRPVPYLKDLDRYVGLWVAVKDGEVKAKGRTSTEVAEALFQQDIHGAVIQYVPEPSNVEKVGLG